MSGEAEADKELGRQLMQVVRAVPHLDTDTLTNMLNSHMQVQIQGLWFNILYTFSVLNLHLKTK